MCVSFGARRSTLLRSSFGQTSRRDVSVPCSSRFEKRRIFSERLHFTLVVFFLRMESLPGRPHLAVRLRALLVRGQLMNVLYHDATEGIFRLLILELVCVKTDNLKTAV